MYIFLKHREISLVSDYSQQDLANIVGMFSKFFFFISQTQTNHQCRMRHERDVRSRDGLSSFTNPRL